MQTTRELSWLRVQQHDVVLEEGAPRSPSSRWLKFAPSGRGTSTSSSFMVRSARPQQQLSVEIEDCPHGMSRPRGSLAAVCRTRSTRSSTKAVPDAALAEIIPETCEARGQSKSQVPSDLTPTTKKEKERVEAEVLHKTTSFPFPILNAPARRSKNPGHPSLPHPTPAQTSRGNLAVASFGPANDPRDETNPGLGVVQSPSGIRRAWCRPPQTGTATLALSTR